MLAYFPKGLAAYRRAQQRRCAKGDRHRRQATDETPSRAVGFCVGRPTRDRRETRRTGLRNLLRAISILRSMSATLAKQFQDYAARCLELARAARTTAGRARFMPMAREYQSAASLIHKELSADLRSGGVARLDRGAEQHSASLVGSAQAGWDRATALADRPTG